jgi:hypothetical protein
MLCEMAAQSAAREYGVPHPVLAALMLTESGRKTGKSLRAWPWTVNMEGAGHWFETESEARAFVEAHFRRGARSFDVGCFQINYKWHHEAFDSIDEMFEPLTNARYAARFLRELFSELGSWDRAAGAYHSRTPALAESYRARFLQHHARVAGEEAVSGLTAPAPLADPPLASTQRRRNAGLDPANSYPLLRAGAGGEMGSLVPSGLFRARPLIAANQGG